MDGHLFPIGEIINSWDGPHLWPFQLCFVRAMGSILCSNLIETRTESSLLQVQSQDQQG